MQFHWIYPSLLIRRPKAFLTGAGYAGASVLYDLPPPPFIHVPYTVAPFQVRIRSFGSNHHGPDIPPKLVANYSHIERHGIRKHHCHKKRNWLPVSGCRFLRDD